MQISGIPAELQRGSLADGLQSPTFLLAEADDDGAIMCEKQQCPVDQVLVPVQADGAIGTAIGRQAKALAADVGRRHEQEFDPAMMFDVVETACISRVVGSSDDAVKP
jgi:hypothetical protein